ncbi:MAG: Nucleotidyltransferase domain protein [Candidatus Bathyarchaeota archaeon BA2]|nr:MAG: Nucleotidyltransferase domain protein [Candidatus Bathyarchaeota archaeon BA2]
MEANRLTGLKKRVARETAILLYTSQEKEYKQAKKRAAKTLGVRVLPSNLEVAEELDKIAEENEGSSRRERLFQMRKEALQIMESLKEFNPRLVGSVWRGTAHQNSDIDILAFSQNPKSVLGQLQKNEYRITGSEWRSVTKRGKKESSFHIHLVLSSGYEAEVVVRDPEKRGRLERCEIYGDAVTGLSRPQLQKVLRKKSLQKFVPT